MLNSEEMTAMNNQKNRFWTFCFSLVPGAGEMYLGLYKQGISLMIAFILLLVVPAMLTVSPLCLFAIIIWFYSFLHTHNLRAMPLEEFCALEDDYIWSGVTPSVHWSGKMQKLVALVLVVLGVYLVWNNTIGWMSWYLDGIFGGLVWGFLHRVPQLAIGVGILWLGVKLITGKKSELDALFGKEKEAEQAAEAPVQAAPVPVLDVPKQAESAAEDTQEAQDDGEAKDDAQA